MDTALAASVGKCKKRSEGARAQAPPVSPWELRYHPQARAEADAVPDRDSKPIKIPVPKKGDVMKFLEKAATVPDPDGWKRSSARHT
jgi:hypothetical protein